jgi:hypothetical protein
MNALGFPDVAVDHSEQACPLRQRIGESARRCAFALLHLAERYQQRYQTVLQEEQSLE